MPRKTHSSEFKAKAVLMSLRENMPLSQLAGKLGVNPNLIAKWRKYFLEHVPEIFNRKSGSTSGSSDELINELYKQIGQLRVENEWLKKKSDLIIS